MTEHPHSSPGAWRRLRRYATLALLAFVVHTAGAQPPEEVDHSLSTIRIELDRIQEKLESEDPAVDLAGLRGKALDLQTQAARIAGELEPALTNVAARLAELGPAPDDTTVKEDPDIAAQRTSLDRSRTALDTQVKLARLLAVESEQAADEVSNLRRSRFSAHLGERTASPLGPVFWAELRENLPHDTWRLRLLRDDLWTAARKTPLAAWTGLLAACGAIFALRLWLSRLAFRFASNRLPPTRLRHSAWALVRTLLSALAYGLAAYAVAWGFDWHGDSPSAVTLLVGNLVGLVVFGAFVRAMGHAVLSARHPGWRLPPLTDEVAHGLRHFPLSFAAVMAGGLLLERLAGLLNAGLATTVAINCLIALGLGGLMANGLRRGLALHRKSVAAMPRPADGRSRGLPWTAVLVGALYLTLLASLVCVLVGYVALGSFVVKQIAWGATVLCTVYLLNVLIDDLFVTWLGAATTSGESESGAAADDTDRSLRVRRQFAVLLSGLCRIFVVICALVVLAAPFGQGPLELLQRTEQLQQGIAVGELQLLPGAVLQAVLVFIVGLTAVRLLQRWLKQRYLPTTTIEPAMRDSMTTLLGFVGSIIALAFALSAVGLSLERIAWVASALSVGIGFGLQAIVSNFVSGLILLAERPVKVGDWVALGGVEGDIRRINVRATEIQQGDRSTVIVPNSEFITKIVRNVTLANPFGLVQIKLPLPLDTDVEQVRTLILEAFKAHESILEVPGPNVFLDTIDAANVVFNANGSVASPRQVYGVRSALLFDILKRLREAGVVLSRPSTLLLQPGSVDPLNPAATPPAAP